MTDDNGTRIVSAEVLVSSPGRNFVTLRLRTADGVTGLGDATVNGRELSVVSYLRDHVTPLLIGRDAHAIEDTWQYLYRGAYWRRGPITMAAIAAVDTALWDIKAKMAGMPLYQLLGGRSRRGCLTYGHASGAELPELFDSIRAHLDQGYRAIRIQTGVPGLGSVYGVASSANAAVGDAGATSRYDHEPARRAAVPVEEEWDTRAYLRHAPRVFEDVRSEFGPELPLLHDAHHRLTPIQAAKLGKELEPYDLFWLEDVTPAENTAVLRRVREHTTTPLAIGEVFNTIWDYRELFEEQLIDYVRSPVTHAGGITALRRIFDYASVYQIKSGVHGPTDISPVGLAAALHLGVAIPNFGIQEYMKHTEATDQVFRPTYSFTDGLLAPSDEPGLGVDHDDAEADRHPYSRAYLPVNRLKLDGSMHDW
ncbi:D-mannonate dehydratase ManD [Lentzea sp. NBRC 102530]|uniref:D-mannonate dehydratase ManD n=1 Tax=Lentzea sp. NBRC 102530 TaxID=3032201 RepID=UPI00249FC4B1|nr:D-mannonate dehydratase ManD [Lentzea sp. NBRC 102530]GLY47735.1 starvation-sensing protein RspA [Lentzea sp. NBRC 102530]